MVRTKLLLQKLLRKFHSEKRFLSGESPLQVFISSVMNDETLWARDTTVNYLSQLPIFSPWAFENTPASSENVQAGYLRKVRESDFVIWLVGRSTTEPVKLEIREALSTNRRILVFKLPSAIRDEETQSLIGEVGKREKWVEVVKKQDFLNALELSMFDEIIRAIREQPGLGRIARYEEMQRASRGRCLTKWQAAGIPLEIAISFYNDPAVGKPPPSVAEKSLVILVGDFGIGKSLIAERIYQIAIDKAVQNSSAPIPVYLNARQVLGNLREKVEELTDGLGNPKRQGAIIVIDGADEVGISASSLLLEKARILSRTWPDTSIIITSRPLPVFTRAEEKVIVPNLSIIDMRNIVSKITGYEITPGMTGGLPKPISDAITSTLSHMD